MVPFRTLVLEIKNSAQVAWQFFPQGIFIGHYGQGFAAFAFLQHRHIVLISQHRLQVNPGAMQRACRASARIGCAAVASYLGAQHANRFIATLRPVLKIYFRSDIIRIVSARPEPRGTVP